MTIELKQRLIRAVDRPGGSSSDFDLNPNVVLPDTRVLRPAAVLVPVTEKGEDRGQDDQGNHHREQGDEDATETHRVEEALREDQERGERRRDQQSPGGRQAGVEPARQTPVWRRPSGPRRRRYAGDRCES